MIVATNATPNCSIIGRIVRRVVAVQLTVGTMPIFLAFSTCFAKPVGVRRLCHIKTITRAIDEARAVAGTGRCWRTGTVVGGPIPTTGARHLAVVDGADAVTRARLFV